MVMEEGPEDGVGKAVIVSVGDVVVEVYCLARVLLHEALVNYGPVLGRDIEPRPADPSETHGLFRAGKGGDEAARGHLEVVFTMNILCDCNWETVGDHDEMLFWKCFGVGGWWMGKRRLE